MPEENESKEKYVHLSKKRKNVPSSQSPLHFKCITWCYDKPAAVFVKSDVVKSKKRSAFFVKSKI